MSLPTEEELVACPDLSDVVPPWWLKYLEGEHERVLRSVGEYERIARDAPVEPYTDLLSDATTDSMHHQKVGSTPLRWPLHPQVRVDIFFVSWTGGERTKSFANRQVFLWQNSLLRIKVRLLDGVMARSTEAM